MSVPSGRLTAGRAWLEGNRRRVSDRVPSYRVYVDPPMTRIGRAVRSEKHGIVQIDADAEEILGAPILGVGDDEVIHSILDIMTPLQ